MASDAVLQARYLAQAEKAKADGIVAHDIASSPLVQALAVWIVVEALQRYSGFGSISGTVLEGASIAKLFNVDKTADDIKKLATALAPIALRTAVVGA